MEDSTKATDELQADVNPGATPERESYKVVSEAGLFKNGKEIKTGGTVELDKKTAAAFLANGDIEES